MDQYSDSSETFFSKTQILLFWSAKPPVHPHSTHENEFITSLDSLNWNTTKIFPVSKLIKLLYYIWHQRLCQWSESELNQIVRLLDKCWLIFVNWFFNEFLTFAKNQTFDRTIYNMNSTLIWIKKVSKGSMKCDHESPSFMCYSCKGNTVKTTSKIVH